MYNICLENVLKLILLQSDIDMYFEKHMMLDAIETFRD